MKELIEQLDELWQLGPMELSKSITVLYTAFITTPEFKRLNELKGLEALDLHYEVLIDLFNKIEVHKEVLKKAVKAQNLT